MRLEREFVGLTLEEAGKLVTPSLNKGIISRLEQHGSGAAHYAEYHEAIVTEAVMKRAAEARRAKAIAGRSSVRAKLKRS